MHGRAFRRTWMAPKTERSNCRFLAGPLTGQSIPFSFGPSSTCSPRSSLSLSLSRLPPSDFRERLQENDSHANVDIARRSEREEEESLHRGEFLLCALLEIDDSDDIWRFPFFFFTLTVDPLT